MDPGHIILGCVHIDFVNCEVIRRVFKNVTEVKSVADGAIERSAGREIGDPQMHMIDDTAQMISHCSPAFVDVA